MKEIQQVLSDIESIKLSLEALSNKGISIIDTFAPITTGVNIITTIFATAFGGWVTIQLFKRQEKMRIKQELRLNFFKEYKSIYDRLLKLLSEFQIELFIVNQMNLNYENKYYSLKEKIIDDKRVLEYEHQKELVSKVIDICNNVYKTMEELDDYLASNEIVLRDYKGQLFEIERAEVLLIKTKIGDLIYNYNNIEIINNPMCVEDMEEINRCKKENKKYFDYIVELETEHGQKKVTNLMKNMKKTHSKIEKEFLGKYFKIKWYKKFLIYLENKF